MPGSRPAYSVRLPAAARPSPAPVAERTVPWLRIAAAYAWRLILVGIVVYGVFSVLGSFQLIAVALFLALIMTAVLRPPTDLLDRFLPRPLCVAIALVGSALLLLTLLALLGNAVAGESGRLAGEFRGGVHR
ncbi:AI-2E family transporter, partial [Streptomyces broussonetiae]